MRINLPVKLGLLTFFIAILGVIGISLYSYHNTDTLLQHLSFSEVEHDLEQKSMIIKNELKTFRDDVMFLSESSSVSGIMRASNSDGYDEQENMTYDMWKARLTRLFKTVIKQRKAYSQLRFIGLTDEGREIVRVNRKNGDIIVVQEKELQSKTHRDYFQEIVNLSSGNIYFSKINLNIEHKKIAIPHQPVLRVGIPVYTENKKLFGFIIINVDFNTLMMQLHHTRADLFYFLTNESGDYLVHPVIGKCYGFDLGRRQLLQDDYPVEKIFYMNEKEGCYRVSDESNDVGIVTHKILIDASKKDRFVILGAVVSFDMIKAESANFRNKIIVVVLIVSVILSIFTGLVARFFTAPIRKLTRISNRIASGGEKLEIPQKGNDEVAELSMSFIKMLSHLEKSRNALKKLTGSLEDKIVERTKELMISNNAINASMNGVVIIDMEENIIDINPSALQILRYSSTRESLLGTTFLNLWQNREIVADTMKEITQEGSWFGEFVAKREDNTLFNAELSANKIIENNNPLGFVISFHDITESKQKEEQHTTILRTALDGFLMTDVTGKILEVNDAYCQMTGYSKEELTGINIDSIEHLDITEHMQRIVEKGHDRFETQHKCKNGKSIYVDVSTNYLIISGGRFFSFIRDITDRKKAEEQLRLHRDNLEELVKKRTSEIVQVNKSLAESEEHFHTLADNAPVGIWRSDENGNFIYINRYCSKIIGLSTEESKGDGWTKWLHPDDKETVYTKWIESIKNDQLYIANFRFLHPNGNLYWVNTQAAAERRTNGEIFGYVGTLTDITEHKHAEEELQKSNELLLHSEKLSAIGKLSASIAHEFNNPICGIRHILENISEIEVNGAIDETDKKQVGMAIKECTRMADLIRKLQDFHRPSSGIAEQIDINETIDDVLLMCKKRLKVAKITLMKDYDNNVPRVTAVHDQIKQVILNLVQNAEDAIGIDGGKIDIITKSVNQNIEISIKDNGSGINNEIISTIFEPFFTTKPAVKGTGLGLSICHGIIKKHGGDITVNSELGKGTIFTIILPVAMV